MELVSPTDTRMRRLAFALATAVWIAVPAFPATAGKADPSQSEIDRIVQSFAANESAFATARENYTYRQSAKIQEFDESGIPGGKYEIVTDVTFTPAHKRQERVMKAPPNTLHLIQMSPEDEQDLRNIMPFVLTSEDISSYNVRYLGRQNADEIPCYVFAVKPKSMESGKRYFTGQIWVDDRDLMIVKSYGRAIGILKKGNDQQFPKFETFREQIDGKYWFPTYTSANSTLYFADSRPSVKQTVKYEDYKQFGAESKIITVDEVKENQQAPAAPKK